MYLKIEDVAETLNLDYKTVYKLVLCGQLPAAKIGAQYRISKEDLDQYLQRQRTTSTAPGVATPAFETASCAKCGIPFRVPSMVGGKCTSPDCDLPLCNTCWEQVDDRFCSEHAQPERLAAMEKAAALHNNGEIAVFLKADAARQRELTFIARFDQAVRKTDGLRSPWDGTWTAVKDWNGICQEEPPLFPAAGATVVRFGRGRRSVPRNVSSFYYLRPEGKKRPFAIAAASYSDVVKFQNKGFDTTPATRETLLMIIENAIELLGTRNTCLALGIASPTGWDSEAEDVILGSNAVPGFSHSDLVIVLVSLYHNTFKFNPSDKRVAPVLDFFIGELEEETLTRVANALRQELVLRDSISLANAVKATGEIEHLVLKSFSKLQSEGDYSVKWIKGLGSVIAKS